MEVKTLSEICGSICHPFS